MATFINRPRIEMRATLELNHAEIAALNELTRFGVDKVQQYLATTFTSEYQLGGSSTKQGKHAEGLHSFLEALAQLGPIRDLHGELLLVAAGTHEVHSKSRM